MEKRGSKRTVKLRDVVLGSGKLALILPLVPENTEELAAMAEDAMLHEPDVLEWRVDYFHDVEDCKKLTEALRQLREQIGNRVLMVTPRHVEENGVREIGPEKKMEILRCMIESGLVDMVDVEMRYGASYIAQIKSLCEKHRTALMISYHDLERTPEQEEIFEKLRQEVELGADVCKVSFVAQSYGDIEHLGEAITKAKRDDLVEIPIVSVSASQIGTLSRIAADAFGSDGTFVSTGKTHQIHIDDLRALRKTLGLEDEKGV